MESFMKNFDKIGFVFVADLTANVGNRHIGILEQLAGLFQKRYRNISLSICSDRRAKRKSVAQALPV